MQNHPRPQRMTVWVSRTQLLLFLVPLWSPSFLVWFQNCRQECLMLTCPKPKRQSAGLPQLEIDRTIWFNVFHASLLKNVVVGIPLQLATHLRANKCQSTPFPQEASRVNLEFSAVTALSASIFCDIESLRVQISHSSIACGVTPQIASVLLWKKDPVRVESHCTMWQDNSNKTSIWLTCKQLTHILQCAGSPLNKRMKHFIRIQQMFSVVAKFKHLHILPSALLESPYNHRRIYVCFLVMTLIFVAIDRLAQCSKHHHKMLSALSESPLIFVTFSSTSRLLP